MDRCPARYLVRGKDTRLAERSGLLDAEPTVTEPMATRAGGRRMAMPVREPVRSLIPPRAITRRVTSDTIGKSTDSTIDPVA
jgi:hypothetical protein